MSERLAFQNPNLCLNPEVVEETGGKGYCNPIYRNKYRDETGDCEGCPRPSRLNIHPKGREFMPESERKEEEISIKIYEDKVRRTSKQTGIYLSR